MEVIFKENVLMDGRRIVAGSRVSLPDAADLIARGLAVAVEVAGEMPPVEEAVAAEKPAAKPATRSRAKKAVAK